MRKVNKQGIGRTDNRSKFEIKLEKEYYQLLENSKKYRLNNRSQTILFSSRQTITRILYYNEIYKLILGKPGVICEFGVEYGATLSLLGKLRGIYEPYNYSRKIIGFDTFSGFTKKIVGDEKKIKWKRGDFSVEKKYEVFLDKVLSFDEKKSPVSHKKKFELVKGDASKTFSKYLDKNKQTLVSLAIFDMDLYQPTKACLKKLIPRLFKGSVIVFDEINYPDFPGETLALLESFNLKKIKLKSFHGQTFASYFIIE